MLLQIGRDVNGQRLAELQIGRDDHQAPLMPSAEKVEQCLRALTAEADVSEFIDHDDTFSILSASVHRKILRCKGRIGKLLRQKQEVFLPKSAMRTAIAYAVNHWVELLRFRDDGHLEIDNNLVENVLRLSRQSETKRRQKATPRFGKQKRPATPSSQVLLFQILELVERTRFELATPTLRT